MQDGVNEGTGVEGKKWNLSSTSTEALILNMNKSGMENTNAVV